jgi:hypothetical protein
MWPHCICTGLSETHVCLEPSPATGCVWHPRVEFAAGLWGGQNILVALRGMAGPGRANFGPFHLRPGQLRSRLCLLTLCLRLIPAVKEEKRGDCILTLELGQGTGVYSPDQEPRSWLSGALEAVPHCFSEVGECGKLFLIIVFVSFLEQG